jgi:seryl-tRNA synthetase
MIDIKKLSINPTPYINEMVRRSKDPYIIESLQQNYLNYIDLNKQLDSKRAIKNSFNDKVIKLQGEEKSKAIVEMKLISTAIKELEQKVTEKKTIIDDLIYKIPNPTSDKTPIGKNSDDNVILKVLGEKQVFSFEPIHYHELPIFKKDYLGEKGVDAFGSRGYYIKGDLARLQYILFQYVLEKITAKGFQYIVPPILVNEKTLYGTGFFPDGIEDTYHVSAGDKTFYLVGTSEAPLMFMHSDSVVDLTKPILLTAQTPCFRKEAGSYGKDTQGGIRVHQFDKVETVALCKPEDADKVFDLLTETFVENARSLGLTLHYLEVCTGDISIKNHRQIDIEAWFPAQKQFRELASSSNCTDYQTRNLNTTYIDSNGNKSLAYSLNCTGVVNRMLYAILEQNQCEDGSVILPHELAKRFGKDLII